MKKILLFFCVFSFLSQPLLNAMQRKKTLGSEKMSKKDRKKKKKLYKSVAEHERRRARLEELMVLNPTEEGTFHECEEEIDANMLERGDCSSEGVRALQESEGEISAGVSECSDSVSRRTLARRKRASRCCVGFRTTKCLACCVICLVAYFFTSLVVFMCGGSGILQQGPVAASSSSGQVYTFFKIISLFNLFFNLNISL